jgi:hypothetical protein
MKHGKSTVTAVLGTAVLTSMSLLWTASARAQDSQCTATATTQFNQGGPSAYEKRYLNIKFTIDTDCPGPDCHGLIKYAITYHCAVSGQNQNWSGARIYYADGRVGGAGYVPAAVTEPLMACTQAGDYPLVDSVDISDIGCTVDVP